jgi:hypothetical protein
MVEERYACPCCGYYTLAERGMYKICPVCWWEDEDDRDVFGDSAPERLRGANHIQLSKARENFLTCGASEEPWLSHVRAPLPDELPENNQHQPRYRPVETIAVDLDLRPPLAPPHLTAEEAIAIAKSRFRVTPEVTYSARYGSPTYPRYRRLDDGAILEPDGTRDFWKVSIYDRSRRHPKRVFGTVVYVDSPVERLVLIDDKAESVVLAG